MSGKTFPKRGEIYWVNLDPAIGGETQKKRPGLIISNDIGNKNSLIVTIAPITSQIKTIFPWEVQITLNGDLSKIMLNQCRALDKSRLANKMGEIDSNTMFEVEDALKLAFGLA